MNKTIVSSESVVLEIRRVESVIENLAKITEINLLNVKESMAAALGSAKEAVAKSDDINALKFKNMDEKLTHAIEAQHHTKGRDEGSSSFWSYVVQLGGVLVLAVTAYIMFKK